MPFDSLMYYPFFDVLNYFYIEYIHIESVPHILPFCISLKPHIHRYNPHQIQYPLEIQPALQYLLLLILNSNIR